MIPRSLDRFQTVLILDSEFVEDAGECCDPVALGMQAYGSEHVQVYDRAELLQWTALPFSCGNDVLVVSYNALSESAFLHVLGLGMPTWWLCLMVESRVMRNICLAKELLPKFIKCHPTMLAPNQDISLLRTAAWFGLAGGDADAKEVAREVVLSRRWESDDPDVWRQIRTYCASDVRLTTQLLRKMEPHLDVQAALIRGRFRAELGRMSQRGIPADVETYTRLQREHTRVLQRYRGRVDGEGLRLTAKGQVRQGWLADKVQALGAERFHPRTATGKWSRKTEALQSTAEQYDDAELAAVAEWAGLLKIFPQSPEGTLRISPLGSDGRVRYHQPFTTHTGRSLGSGNEVLMQLPGWMRGLITPREGEVLLAADYAAQEIGVAAGLSKDAHLREVYLASDPYLTVAAMAGLIQADTPEPDRRHARKLCKSLVLGRQYGMGLTTFRERSGLSFGQASKVWQWFDRTFTQLTQWQAQTVAHARRRGFIRTRYGWTAQVDTMTPTTTLYNWPVQSHAADILHLAVILVAQAGFALLTTCHDSLLVSIPDDRVDERCLELKAVMGQAAEVVVGVPIRIDVQIVRPGERLLTPETAPKWQAIIGLLDAA